MFFCGKKIGYLSIYKNGEKTEPAGFVKMQLEGSRMHISVQVKINEKVSGEYPFWICVNEERIFVTNVVLEDGKGISEYVASGSRKEFLVDKKVIACTDITGFILQPKEEVTVEVRWQAEKAEQEEKERESEENDDRAQGVVSPAPAKIREAVVEKTDEVQIYAAEDYSEDKWEQLQKQFRCMHPFGDERVYIAIELKDFTVLRQEYQKLVHNSFLLHGFYNYRHLIVGKDNKLGNSYETCFYLGVPGVFYEKEKMVAVMFGFEGFECEGAVSIGKYGYYLRQIQI